MVAQKKFLGNIWPPKVSFSQSRQLYIVSPEWLGSLGGGRIIHGHLSAYAIGSTLGILDGGRSVDALSRAVYKLSSVTHNDPTRQSDW